MKSILIIALLTCISTNVYSITKQNSIKFDRAIEAIKNSNFASKRGISGIFSYKDNDVQRFNTQQNEASFNSDDFNEWKRVCFQAAQEWIYKDSSKEIIKEYEICRNITSELTLALAIISKKFDNHQELKNNLIDIRKTLEPAIEASKKIKSSFFKSKLKGSPAKDIIQAIRDILNKRVKEIIDDFNDRIKSSGETNIKKLSL